MSFMFNFSVPEDENSSCDASIGNEPPAETNLLPCTEIFVPPSGHKLLGQGDIPVVRYQISEDLCVECLQSQAVEERLCRQSVEERLGQKAAGEWGAVQAAHSHSDLLPNVYEGGLKVWECAVDLAQYLHSSDVSFQGKCVAELGCGAGLPGIVAMRGGASQVHFQDYNVEVIENYTIPNTVLNKVGDCTCKCKYFSGDWDTFRQLMVVGGIRYDIILTAETIYRKENYTKLSQVFKDCLAPSGVVYLAAKSNYFGVGGGTNDFANFLDKQGTFQAEICHTVDEGLPREIWRICFR